MKNTLLGMEERAARAINPLTTISPIVLHLRNGILSHFLSDRAPSIGEVTNANKVASEKLAPYRISGNALSMINH